MPTSGAADSYAHKLLHQRCAHGYQHKHAASLLPALLLAASLLTVSLLVCFTTDCFTAGLLSLLTGAICMCRYSACWSCRATSMAAFLTGLHRWQSPSSSKRRHRPPPMLTQSVLVITRRHQAYLSRTIQALPGEVDEGSFCGVVQRVHHTVCRGESGCKMTLTQNAAACSVAYLCGLLHM